MAKRSSHRHGRNVVPFVPRSPIRLQSIAIAALLAGIFGFAVAGGKSNILEDADPPVRLNAHVKVASNPPAEVVEGEISGRAVVIDGDTIDIAGSRVRLNGIDAPESKQTCRNAKGKNYRCGQTAAKALDGWLAQSRPLTCAFIEWDQYGRFVGDCERADGASVAVWLVSSGHALDWPRHSGGAYASHQAEAQAARRGIWQGEFQQPWEWRAAQQAPKAEVSSPPVRLLSESCDIKGNVSKKGERIYHVPGQRYYEETVITQSKGERMFCSEDEARAAGWRRSKR